MLLVNKEELIGKLQMVYVGNRNALNELIGYYDGLKQGIEELQQENQKYKEVINKAIEYIEKLNKIIPRFWFTKLLELLKEVE